MERRTFLRRGLLGGLVLAAGGVSYRFTRPSARLAAPREPLSVLDERSFQVMLAVARRVLTVPGVDHLAVVHAIDDALSYARPEVKGDIAKLLETLEGGVPGLVFDAQWGRFTTLPACEQDRVLRAWRDSRIGLRRAGYVVLRKACFFAAYASPSLWPSLHYPGPPDFGGFAWDDSKVGTKAWLAAQPRAGGEAP